MKSRFPWDFTRLFRYYIEICVKVNGSFKFCEMGGRASVRLWEIRCEENGRGTDGTSYSPEISLKATNPLSVSPSLSVHSLALSFNPLVCIRCDFPTYARLYIHEERESCEREWRAPLSIYCGAIEADERARETCVRVEKRERGSARDWLVTYWIKCVALVIVARASWCSGVWLTMI